jgi:hypothetical protein
MRARMAYCGPRGIPLSTFLAWPIDDQEAALLWQAEEDQRCRSCGTAAWEWEENFFAYQASQQVCRGCAVLDGVRKDLNRPVHGGKSQADMVPGLQLSLVKRASEPSTRPGR